MKKCMPKIYYVFFLLLLIGGLMLIYWNNNKTTVTYEPADFTEQTDYLSNPDRGWYQLYGYQLSEDTSYDASSIYLETHDAQNREYRLALVEINLAQYREGELSDTALKNVETIFTAFENTNMKLILRFVYDWDGNGEATEPELLSVIKTHMEQLGSVLTRHQDILFTLQGIFVGSWGEMHSSRHLSENDVTTLIMKLEEVTPDSVFLAVRTPAFYRSIMKNAASRSTAFEHLAETLAGLEKRLGLFNDALLGSETDLGTYVASEGVSAAETRQKELAFQDSLCSRVPNGGEVVQDNTYNDLTNAIADFETMHITYLNQIYDKDVLDKWKRTVYEGEDTVYRNLSGYKYITDHLGYRFVLKDAALTYESLHDKYATLHLTVANRGFANTYTDKQLKICITRLKTGSTDVLLQTDCEDDGTVLDARTWNSGEEVHLPIRLNPHDYPEGEYEITLQLIQKDEHTPILFANREKEENTGIYSLGTISIRH